MPVFFCSKCTKTLNHVVIYNNLVTAPLPDNEISTPTLVMGEQERAETASDIPDVMQSDWSSQPDPEDQETTIQPLTFEHHAALPEFMQKLMNELNTQRARLDQHDQLYLEFQHLQQQLTEAHKRVAELEKANKELQQQLADQEHPRNTAAGARTLTQDVNDFPSLSTLDPRPANTQNGLTGSIWNQPESIRILKRPPTSTSSARKQEAAARAFVLPSDNHGFQYIYLPARARIPTGQMRAKLRKLGIDNSRVLDIHYPDRQVVALLMHNDFVPMARETLNKFGVKPLESFDPCSSSNLRDPKYAQLSSEDRQKHAKEHHNDRMLRALNFLRIPVRYAVARQFTSIGWITVPQLREILATRRTISPSVERQNEHQAADIFQQTTNMSDHDELMTNDLGSMSSLLIDEPAPTQPSPNHE